MTLKENKMEHEFSITKINEGNLNHIKLHRRGIECFKGVKRLFREHVNFFNDK